MRAFLTVLMVSALALGNASAETRLIFNQTPAPASLGADPPAPAPGAAELLDSLSLCFQHTHAGPVGASGTHLTLFDAGFETVCAKVQGEIAARIAATRAKTAGAGDAEHLAKLKSLTDRLK